MQESAFAGDRRVEDALKKFRDASIVMRNCEEDGGRSSSHRVGGLLPGVIVLRT